MEAHYQDLILPQAQFRISDSASSSTPRKALSSSEAFCDISLPQNTIPFAFAYQPQWIYPPVVLHPTFCAFFEEATQYGQEFEATPTEPSSSFSDSATVASPELGEYKNFLDYNYQSPTMSTMPLHAQSADANIYACGTFSTVASSQASMEPFYPSLISTSTHSASAAPSYEGEIALSNEILGNSSTTTVNYETQLLTAPGIDIDRNPLNWLTKDQEKSLLDSATQNTNTITENGSCCYPQSLSQLLRPSGFARGQFNVPIFDLSRIDTCHNILLGSIDQVTQRLRPVSLDDCLNGRVDDPGKFVFEGWEPGFFTFYMVHDEKQERPRLVRIATELEDGRKMTKAHLAHLIAGEYTKMQHKLGLRGFPCFMDPGYTYAGECGRVDFNRIKVTHIKIDRTTSIGYPNLVIGYSATC